MLTFHQYLESIQPAKFQYIGEVRKELKLLGLNSKWQPHDKEISLYYYEGIGAKQAARTLSKKYKDVHATQRKLAFFRNL